MEPKPVIYYGRPIERSYFTERARGFRRFFSVGWRVRLIFLFSSLVDWAQRKVEWHVMHFIARNQGLEKDVVRALESRFVDEDEERKAGTGRRNRALAAFGVPGVSFAPYAEGRKNGALPDEEPPAREVAQRQYEEPNATLERLARLMADQKERRYSGGRDVYTVQEVEAEPVGNEELINRTP
jgi:hypothetical protein